MPMMAHPHEYADTLYRVLHDGEITPEMRKKMAEGKSERAKSKVGRPPPKSALAELEAVRERARALQEQQQK